MIHLRQAVVVEGKYDKIRLSALVDGPILVTNGFRIFKNREQLALLRPSGPAGWDPDSHRFRRGRF